MLPKQHRLSLRTEFKRLREEGKLFQGKLFGLLVATKPVGGLSRFTFLVSTKIHKMAHKRNRARRLISEAVYELLPKVVPGFEGVFLVKKGILEADFKQIKTATEEIFRKAKLLVL